jgi:hypothetical protein
LANEAIHQEHSANFILTHYFLLVPGDRRALRLAANLPDLAERLRDVLDPDQRRRLAFELLRE